MTEDVKYMHRAHGLALLGSGHVSPNPLVGCVIMHDNKVIGEGWHKQFGQAHAEVNAVEAVVDKSLLKEATVYVNLEPCSHQGKTPPCADMLIKHNVKRVVVSNLDTNPLVAGQGIKKLREAGLEVVTGVLEKEGRHLNRRFFCGLEKKRPYVILKWAQTADHFLAHENFESRWISNAYARQLVHRWRSEEDAVLVGTRTAQYDNPTLNVRTWTGRNPVRIVIDRFLRLNKSLHLFDSSQSTLCFNVLRHEEHELLKYIRLNEKDFWNEMLNYLHQHGIHSVMIEGGATTLNQFLDNDLWDEARVFTSTRSFGKGIAAPVLHRHLASAEDVMGDQLGIYLN